MGCPHLINGVKINREIISEKSGPTKHWQCIECQDGRENWMCLYCGIVLCGRYDNQHAKLHANNDINTDHYLCIHCEILSVFCYKCDDFIEGDDNENVLEEVRQYINEHNSVEDSNNESPVPSISDTTAEDDILKHSGENVRNLRPRPRKRSLSTDTSSVENDHKKSSSKSHREKKVVGLRNLGNTCFMNAVLQSLSNIQEFSCYFSSLPSLEAKNKGRRIYHSRSLKEFNEVHLVEELRKVLLNLSQGGGGCGSKGAISPECLFLVIWKVVPRFRGYQQQDAHEFLRYVLDRLHTELQLILPDSNFKDGSYISSVRGRNSIVTSVFGGTLQSEVKCLQCGTESKKHDPFLDLSLDIPDHFAEKKGKDDDPGPMCNIADCLTSFTEVEELAESELYYCNSCKSKQRSTKQFWIRRLPNVLCLHIKRFRWNNFFRTKIDVNISFPVTALDMSQFILSNLPETRRSGTGNNLYDLAAIIVHHGSGAGSGHYTSFAKHSGQWFHFNDSTVRPTDIKTVANCKPYILFYIRRELNLNVSHGNITTSS